MEQKKQKTSTETNRRWEPLSDDVMDLIYERIIKLRTLGRMGEIYLKYQCECVEKYDIDLDMIALWLEIFSDTTEEIGLLMA